MTHDEAVALRRDVEAVLREPVLGSRSRERLGKLKRALDHFERTGQWEEGQAPAWPAFALEDPHLSE